MGDSSFFGIPSRLAAEGEQLVVHRFPGGSLGLASITDVRHLAPEVSTGNFWQRIRRRFQDAEGGSNPIPPVCVPPGAHLILKGIPGAIQQRYGLQDEEGALFVQISAGVSGYRDELRFNNGVQIRLQELRAGQLVEVLSLAGTHPALYEQELQMQL
jgi:hypothetical protein